MTKPMIDTEDVIMILLLGILLLITLFRQYLLQLISTPIPTPTISISPHGYNNTHLDTNTKIINGEGFEDIANEIENGGVSQVVNNFIRLAAYTRSAKLGMMNTLNLDTHKIVNPDTDVVVKESIMIKLAAKNNNNKANNNNNNNNDIEALNLTDGQRELLLDIGSRNKKEERVNDYYLDADEGLDITLDMNFNAVDVNYNSVIIPSTMVIKELGSGKIFNIDNPSIIYSAMYPNVITLDGNIKSNELSWETTIYNIIQNFKIRLYFAKPLTTLLTGTNKITTFKELINDHLVLARSNLTYTLYVPPLLTIPQSLYSIQYYFRRGEVTRSSIAEITNTKMQEITDEILKEKVPSILSPLYLLDHEIGKMSTTIKTISDEYRGMELAERQRQLQFYDTYA